MSANTAPTPDTKQADLLLAQGLAASQAGQSEQAITLWQQASSHVPHAGMPHFLIGSEYAAQGNVRAAETAFANAVLLAPGLSLARYQLGLLLMTTDRMATALVIWQPLLTVSEADPITPALAQFVRGHAALAQNDFAQAVALFNAGIKLNTTHAPVSDDIRQLIQRIEAVQSQPTGH
jgi:tetratricopeptide (TPR) repeat protein